MWLLVDYEMVAAFGLRPSNTTSNGGKSLLCPTPYAIKMALLDRLIRTQGETFGREVFPFVRNLEIWMRLPLAVAVNRTFQKVLRVGGKDEVWISTISQREYCFHVGAMTLAFRGEETLVTELPRILSMINYFGRKGSFVQYSGDSFEDDLPRGFVNACAPPAGSLQYGFLQRMDDMRRDATFEEVSALHPKKSGSDGGRLYHNVVFPYQLKHHGFNHTVYERTS